MEQNEKWKKVRKVLINKYAITLYVFAVILLLVLGLCYTYRVLHGAIWQKREKRRMKDETL